MAITNMAELEALRPGDSIRVTGRRSGNRTYTRTDEGFQHDGYSVALDYFTGYVKAGAIINLASADPEPGDHFFTGSVNHYIVLSVAEGEVAMARFRREQFVEIQHRHLADVRDFNWTRVQEKPPWHAAAYSLATTVANLQAEMRTVRADMTEARQARDSAAIELVRTKEVRAAVVKIVATGSTTLSHEKATAEVPSEAKVTSVKATWTREFSYTTEPKQGCQCAAVTREMVAEMLGIADERDSLHDFGYTTDCGRH